jgi:putative hemolysin
MMNTLAKQAANALSTDMIRIPGDKFFYTDDDGLLVAMRQGDLKYVFAEQRMPGTLAVWAEPFTKLRLQRIYNLFQDPFERADITSNAFWDWNLNHVGSAYGMMDEVFKFAATFKAFPPRSFPPSFNPATVLEETLEDIKRKRTPWRGVKWVQRATIFFAALWLVPCCIDAFAQVQPPPQLANPASQNCATRGGTLKIERRPDGGQFGVCVFTDNYQCEEWAMFRGECPTGGLRVTGYITPAARYCAITGGRYMVVARSGGADEQGACALPGGKACDADAYYASACGR